MSARCGKVLIVSSRAPFGNSEPYLRSELRELRGYFESIGVVPVRSPRGERQPLPPGIDVFAWPLFSLGLAGRAARIVLRSPLRALHALRALTGRRSWLKNAALAVKSLAIADLAQERGYEHIHAYWLSAPATVAMVAARAAGVPWSATAHRWDIYERNAFDQKARDVSFVRTISRRGAEDVGEAMPALGSRIVRIPLGAEVPAYHEVLAAQDGLRVVCPAALVPVKGHEHLLDALALLRDRGVPVACTIAGEGPLRADLERRVRERSLEAIVAFAGYLPQEALHQAYRSGRFNVVALTSVHRGGAMEGIPSALIEAMAFGVPVVATASGSVDELVDDSCGHLVRPADAEALARALADVYANPSEAAARAGHAYERVAQRHDVRACMRDLAAAISGQRSFA